MLAQEGDKGAYERFLYEASQVLRSFLSRRMGEIQMVEDVLQDTLLSVHRARHTFRPQKPVGPWLYAICEHRMTDFYRRYRRLERIEVSTPDDIEDIVAASPDRQDDDRGAQVRAALEKLPDKQRKVIELLKIHGLSVKQVAAQTGMTESSVKVTAFKGYEAIRRSFGAKEK